MVTWRAEDENENCLFTQFAEKFKTEPDFEMCRKYKGIKCK